MRILIRSDPLIFGLPDPVLFSLDPNFMPTYLIYNAFFSFRIRSDPDQGKKSIFYIIQYSCLVGTNKLCRIKVGSGSGEKSIVYIFQYYCLVQRNFVLNSVYNIDNNTYGRVLGICSRGIRLFFLEFMTKKVAKFLYRAFMQFSPFLLFNFPN